MTSPLPANHLTLLRADRSAAPLAASRLASAKRAYATRRIALDGAASLLADRPPCAGDLVLARVEAIGQHTALELPSGRRAQLYPGDEILVCYGNRYAPDQFEALVPEDLGPCHLVAAGGIASRCLSSHRRMKPPTAITPIGLVGDRHGAPLNLRSFAAPAQEPPAVRPHVTAVVGSSMNAGKTTTVASLIHGMRATGLRVGAAKVTGTGAGGDVWAMLDAGAACVLDFTDAGHPSTFRLPAAEIEATMVALVAELSRMPVDAILIEVADGLFFEETATLVESKRFRATVDALVFAAADAMSAYAGSEWLARRGLPLAALSGLFTASPLAVREVDSLVGLPIVDREVLRAGEWLPQRTDGVRAALA